MEAVRHGNDFPNEMGLTQLVLVVAVLRHDGSDDEHDQSTENEEDRSKKEECAVLAPAEPKNDDGYGEDILRRHISLPASEIPRSPQTLGQFG